MSDGPFYTRKLKALEQTYPLDDLNCTAVLFALKNFKIPCAIIRSLFDPIVYLQELKNPSRSQQRWLRWLCIYSFSWEPTFILDEDIIKIDPTIPLASQISSKRDIKKREIISQFLTTYRRVSHPAISSVQNNI